MRTSLVRMVSSTATTVWCGIPAGGYTHSPRSEMTMAVYACWINSMGSVYQYLDHSEITDSYGRISPVVGYDYVRAYCVESDGIVVDGWNFGNFYGRTFALRIHVIILFGGLV